MSFRLGRTRHRGVYSSNGRYVIPVFDELGRERRREFDTLAQARDFERGLRIVEKAKKVSRENWASNKHPGGYGN